jgi:hypothetical protein
MEVAEKNASLPPPPSSTASITVVETATPTSPDQVGETSEMERDISYDGDSDSGEDVVDGAVPKASLSEDFLHDAEGEITGGDINPPSKKEETVSHLLPHLTSPRLINDRSKLCSFIAESNSRVSVALKCLKWNQLDYQS